MPYRSGLRVLDCGCGEGTLLEQLDGRAETPWGIDRVRPQASLDATLHQVSIAREYGDKLTFLVGIDVQHTLQERDPAGVREEVRFLIDTFDRPEGGMCIAADTVIVGGEWHCRRDAL